MTSLHEVIEKNQKEFLEKISSMLRFVETHTGIDENYSIKSSFLSSHLSLLKAVIQELEKIAPWPEPKEGAGQELGPLAGVGMYMQYDVDRKNHEKQISDLKSSIEEEIEKLK